MAFDACMLDHVVGEINETVGGGRLDRIFQPERDEIVLSFHASGKDAGGLVWRDNYALKFSEAEMAGLSAKLGKPVGSAAAVSPNLAGDGN